MRCGGHVAHMEDVRIIPEILVRNPQRNGRFGRPVRRWGYNIRMGLMEIGWECVD
jgi:hypothetical protein